MLRLLIAFLGLLIAFQAPAQSPFVISPDSQNRGSSLTRNATTYVDARVLGANVAETHTVPAGVSWVVFSSTCAPGFFARTGASIAIPAADITDGTSPEFNVTAWRLYGETQISLISSTACTVMLAFYK